MPVTNTEHMFKTTHTPSDEIDRIHKFGILGSVMMSGATVGGCMGATISETSIAWIPCLLVSYCLKRRTYPRTYPRK